jgi:hypothetical protein
MELSKAVCKSRTLDIADDGTSGVIHELDTHLSDTTAGTSTAEDAYVVVSK